MFIGLNILILLKVTFLRVYHFDEDCHKNRDKDSQYYKAVEKNKLNLCQKRAYKEADKIGRVCLILIINNN